MRNGDPTSLRMAFGYTEARASGVTGFDGPPTASKMNWSAQCAAADKKIRELTNADPLLIPIALDIRAAFRRYNSDGAPQVLEGLYIVRPELVPPGFSRSIPDWFLPPHLLKKRK